MNARLVHKKPGQSIPLIALMLVVLLGMVGLSVDVGNTYAEQRSAVRATNAAALAGMSNLIAGGDDQGVADAIKASLRSNKIDVADSPDGAMQPGQRAVEARYMGPDGNYLSACRVGQCGNVPQGVGFIEVKLSGTVQTYFARVVGRPTLPVGATAFSAQCLPINGVYPFTVWNNDLNATQFKTPQNDPSLTGATFPYGNYSDANYQNKNWRRIYLKENTNSSGNFSLMQWSGDNSAGNAGTTEASFTNEGNLKDGFDEVTPWPDPNMTAPANYPLAPHQLSVGDWVNGNTGLSWGKLSDAVYELSVKRAHTVVTLPIIDKEVGNGSNAAFHVARFGSFYILNVDSHDPDHNGNDKYIDLAYLGEVKGTACLQTNVEPANPTEGPPIRVRGQTFIKPRWQSPNVDKPVSYQIVLDVSGSMSLDYFGLGTLNATHYYNPSKDSTGGADYWCSDWYNPDAPPSNNSYTKKFDCQAGANNAVWKKYEERRIYLAKKAIKTLIASMSAQDTMRVISFSTSFGSTGAKAYPTSGWSPDKTLLSGAVEQAGMYNNDPYRTSGGTPGADAMKATRDLLKAGNKPKTSPDGRAYKNVIIYLTDGMANVFLGGAGNTARDICSDISPEESKSTARCQLDVTSDGKLRPITAMIDQADKMKQENSDLVIYTIGMAGVDEAGLPQVASSPSNFYAANQPGVLDSILLNIKGRESAACVESGASGAGYQSKIDSQNKAQFSGTYALPDGVYGYVYLFDDKQQPLPGDQYKHAITMDSTGLLAWAMPEGKGLAPGNYIMNAWLGFKGSDGQSRIYSVLENQSTLKQTNNVPFSVSYTNVLGSEFIAPAAYLNLDGAVCP